MTREQAAIINDLLLLLLNTPPFEDAIEEGAFDGDQVVEAARALAELAGGEPFITEDDL